MHFSLSTSRSSATGRVFRFSIFLVTFSFASVCPAQTSRDTSVSNLQPAKFELGVAGGFSLNRFSDGQPQTGLNTGYAAGLILNFNLHNAWSLQIEANLLQQGGQLISFKDDTKLGLPESFTTKNVKNSSVRLNSLEIPLLVKYTIPLKQSWRPALYIGGSYAYNLNATDHYQKTGDLLPGEDILATVNDSENVTSVFKRERYNMIIGADLRLPLFCNVKMLLDFRYLAGLTPAREHYSYMEKVGFGVDIRSNSFISRIGLIVPIH